MEAKKQIPTNIWRKTEISEERGRLNTGAVSRKAHGIAAGNYKMGNGQGYARY